MKLLALDPGTLKMGAALFDFDLKAERATLASAESIITKGWDLSRLAGWLSGQLAQGVGIVAIEQPGDHPFQRQESGTKLWHWIGALEGVIAMFDQAYDGPTVHRVPDGDVKEALTGQRNGHKYQVHWALQGMGYALPWCGRAPTERSRGADKRARCESCQGSKLDPRHSPDAADAIAVGHVLAARLFMEARAL